MLIAAMKTWFRAGAGLALACAVSLSAHGFPSAPYMPLADGNQWTYRINSFSTETRTVLTGTTNINGVETKALRYPDGYIQYLTSDANGIRDHREFDPLDSSTVTFDPPLKFADGDGSLGVPALSSGTATYSHPVYGAFLLSYTATATPMAFETVTLPAGTFTAIKINVVARIFGNILNEPYDEMITQVIWAVENVGVIREESGSDIYELTTLSFQPVLTFSSTAFTWPSQPANGLPGAVSSGPMVSNNGNFPVQISSVTVTGEFGINQNTCTGLQLAPGGGCIVYVDFRPTTPGPKTGTLTVVSNAVGSPFIYALSGTGNPVGIPSVSPSSLDFGSQDRGIPSVPRTVTLSNSGTASVNISGIVASGDYARTTNCGASLSVGASCTIDVTFTPFAAGTRNGSLIIYWDSGQLSVQLTGTGVGEAPPLNVSPTSLDFGGQILLVTSAPRVITLTNGGTGTLFTLQIGNPSLPLGDFAFTTNCGTTLVGGASCAINVTFTPTAIGSRYGYIEIHTDASNGNRLLTLMGFGTAAGSDTTPDPFGFPPVSDVALNTWVTSSPVTVTGIDAVAPVGILGGEYSVNGGPFTSTPGTVTNGQYVTVRNFSAPTNGTTTTATLTIGGVSGSFAVTTLPDIQAPSTPLGLTATAVSGSQINLLWNPASDNVGIAAYQVFRGGVFLATVNAPALVFSDSGLTADTPYSYTVAACDAAGNCSGQSGSASATTLAPGQYAYSPVLELGFNLISNALNAPLDVVATFGNQDAPAGANGEITANVVSIWKWEAMQGRWAFSSPQMSASGSAAYAAAHNYDVLTIIDPGEGYWVNAIVPMTLPPQSGTGFNWDGFNFAALPSGFNLITTADAFTPSQFNLQVSPTPPSPGVVPTDNFTTLWAWDAQAATWYFYSPLLEATGGLPAVKAYADSHFFRHFQEFGKVLGLGTGFWVNKP